MNDDLETSERPPLFQIGILLTTLHAALKLMILSFVSLALLIGIPIGMANADSDGVVALGFVGAFALGFVVLFALLYLATIVVAYLAWKRSRPAIWVLIGLSALAATSFPFGTVVGVLTIVGCVQALERPSD